MCVAYIQTLMHMTDRCLLTIRKKILSLTKSFLQGKTGEGRNTVFYPNDIQHEIKQYILEMYWKEDFHLGDINIKCHERWRQQILIYAPE